MGKIKLVVTDLDGTFLTRGKRVTARNLAAVERLRQRGIGFTVASGRMYGMYEAYLGVLQVALPVISCDGAVISTPDGQELLRRALPVRTAAEILAFAAAESMDYITYVGDRVYFIKGSERIERFAQYNAFARQSGRKEIAFSYYDESSHEVLARQGAVKILLLERSGGDIEKMRKFLQAHPDTATCAPEGGALDIVGAQVSKGAAVLWLAERLGIAPEEICAVGDHMNDESMLRAVGLPVVMGNACAPLKAMRAAKTPDCDASGFAVAIERYVLNSFDGRGRHED